MENIYEAIKEKYITKTKINSTVKMERNLQPEIEKIRSIRLSLSKLGFINVGERNRIKIEVQQLLKDIERL